MLFSYIKVINTRLLPLGKEAIRYNSINQVEGTDAGTIESLFYAKELILNRDNKFLK